MANEETNEQAKQEIKNETEGNNKTAQKSGDKKVKKEPTPDTKNTKPKENEVFKSGLHLVYYKGRERWFNNNQINIALKTAPNQVKFPKGSQASFK